jgi:hypothetical protein
LDQYLGPVVSFTVFCCHRFAPPLHSNVSEPTALGANLAVNFASESSIAMDYKLPSPDCEWPRVSGFMNDRPASMAERELFTFINSVADMFGPDQATFLEGIWLDALASMDRMPEPASSDWRLVTLAASALLAIRLIAVPNPGTLY